MKRILLKGKTPCILTLGEASAQIEWLHGRTEEPILLFYDTEEAVPLKEPLWHADRVVAAAIGSDLHTRGQLAAFDWQRAREYLRLHKPNGASPSVSDPPMSSKSSLSPTASDPPAMSKAPTPPAPSAPSLPPAPPRCACTLTPKRTQIDPFPRAFPASEWVRHEFSGARWHYLTGNLYQDGALIATATAVPGKNNFKPPAWLKEFSRFLYSESLNQGYWVAVNPIKTEEKS